MSTNRVLVKLRPTSALRAAESRANLRPLYESPVMTTGFGVEGASQWYIAELPDGAATPWDLAHARVAGQLGVTESDVEFAEPDLIHNVFVDTNEQRAVEGMAIGAQCDPIAPDVTRGKKLGADPYPWHLRDDFSQLGSAREEVQFTDPRTRIAHIDTGYYREHVSLPAHMRFELERNFAEDESGAEDPGKKRRLFDNSGHGTGTLSILAGGRAPDLDNLILGGAPGADIVPIRVAQSVIMLRTSALAKALEYAIEQRCDVISMSMGGLPTRAWAEAVDKLYDAGICFCAAAGNHVGISPPRVMVYPARYPRVIGVCGVMADHSPYAGLQGTALEGSFGPADAMKTAIAAYTPNIPWAVFGCETLVRRNGEGTSAATPQVAAAAALYFEKYKKVLPRDHQRVEAVRRALFSTASHKEDAKHFGNGVIKARAALGVAPVLGLPKAERSKNSFALVRLITGLGITEAPPREQMFNLELTQRWLMNPELQELLENPDREAPLEQAELRKVMQAIIEDPEASLALRKHVASRYPVAGGAPAPATERAREIVPPDHGPCDVQPELRNPPYRRIRVYAADPSFSTRLATASTNEVTLKVRWEELEPGPVGEYLSVEDEYEPVDLDKPALLAQDGWAPSEGNPQFHQQMIYAVAMKTISHFEKALGRPVLWRHAAVEGKPFDDSQFVRRLAVLPHALRQANAFYSPTQIALLFGWFEAAATDPGEHMPGSRVYSALSHDIIAHEITHAILDGMYRRFNEATNVDVLAFHEGFADIVALMQHFTIAEVLEREISKTRGNLEEESIMGSLAVQFGQTMGGRGALRNAIGSFENGVWKRFVPDPGDLQKRQAPHARGAVLVAAVFDAFLAIYRMRTADLLRIYTGGTGVLPSGAIHPDLVRRLADEASKAANHVLTMCIRALDYLPPVDVTFFEYLRALITADFDLVADDRHDYRVAFVEAFRRRGIYPLDVGIPGKDTPRTLSVDTLRWQGGVDLSRFTDEQRKAIAGEYAKMIAELRRYADATIYVTDREKLFAATRKQREDLHTMLGNTFVAVPELAAELGLEPNRSFEVHELRQATRVSPEGRYIPQVVVMLTQTARMNVDGEEREFRSGATLVVDLSVEGVKAVKYRIVKSAGSQTRMARTAAFVRQAAADPLRALFLAPEGNEPFSALHGLADEGF